MKKKFKVSLLTAVTALSCTIFFTSCANKSTDMSAETSKVAAVESQQTTTAPPVVEEKAAASVKSEESSSAPLYTETPRSLPPVECGSCHGGEYTRLQQSNSKHRFDCLDCHDQLHAYIPTANNYKEIIPKCANCHDLPHGAAFPGCAQCHQDPHTPLIIPFSGVEQKIKNKAGKSVVACSVCHLKEGAEMDKHPCIHNTEVGCTGCHADKHGVRPTCFDCHEPHVAGQTYANCLECHAPHSAKNILHYAVETPNNVCGSCHDGIYNDLQQNHTKHTDVQCADCHLTHGQIPQCQRCHGEPHGKTVHQKFPDCLKCHLDPHNLPVDK
jgi:predicted CXXCH cytochrome family protein